VPDHELLRCIGRGSYGDVWLARNVLGEFRAVKIVYRDRFEHERPYEREFEGIRKFEPNSRLHDSQVDILHVGRNDQAGCFYYVMELADCAQSEREKGGEGEKENHATASLDGRNTAASVPPAPFPPFSPANYVPHTLKLDLHRRTRLPVDECLSIGLALTTAVQHLHEHGLVHRDIKPSNIIFVGGVPKLADIGLVASMDATMSFVGTSGFLPPEGPGTPQGDLYSLGKVLYEISMGRDRTDFPKLPPELIEGSAREPRALPETFDDPARLLELNAVILKACHHDPRHRYQSAQEMGADLALLQRGESVKRKRAIQRRLAAVTKFSLVAGLITLMAVGGFLLRQVVNKNQPGSTGAPPQPEMKGTKNREAWNAYLNGLHYSKRTTPDGSKRAIGYLKEAIRLDTNFAPAYAALAELYPWSDYLFPSGQEAMVKAKEVASQALALDDSLAQAHKVLGYVAADLERDFPKAEKEMKRAIELSPDYASGHEYYGWILLEMGRVDEAKKQVELAQRLDPVSPRICCEASMLFLSTGQADEAVEKLHKALDLDPNYSRAFEQLGEVHEEKGEFPEAIEMLRKAAIVDGIEPGKAAKTSEDLRRAFSTGSARGYWRKKLELADVRSNFGGDLYNIAVIYLHLGEKDSVFDFLEKVEAQKSDWAFRVNFDRRFDGVRSDPRFLGLLRKLGLEKWGRTSHGDPAR